MRTSAKLVTLGVLLVLAAGVGASSAAAVTPGPDWTIRADTKPTNISPSEGGSLTILVTNSGAQPSNGEPITIKDVLPPDLRIVEVEANKQPGEEGLSCLHTATRVSCEYPAALAGDQRAGLAIRLTVLPESEETGPLEPANVASVSGAGAAPASVTDGLNVSAAEPTFGIQGAFAAELLDQSGALDTRAAGHPNLDTTGFVLNSVVVAPLAPGEAQRERTRPAQDLQRASVELPPGLVGDPQATVTCPQYLITPPGQGRQCPPASVVGSAAVTKVSPANTWSFSGATGNPTPVASIFNVPPERGHAAQFEFLVTGQVATLYANVIHTPAGYVIQVTSADIPRLIHLAGVKVTFFGDPAAVDGAGLASQAFFTNPADCAGGPLTTSIELDSWQGSHTEATSTAPPPSGCNKLTFHPEFEAKPTSEHTSAPSGLNVELKIPQNEDPEGLATPPLEDVTVELPRGLSISPSSANGLQACSDAQFDVESTEPAACPNASVVGSVKVHTPLLKEELEGQVFVGTPECNPCSNADAQSGRIVRLLIEIKNAARGIDVKLPGTVSLDPGTGQLTATFTQAPQLPFDDLEFKFKSGERAPLSTPAACGSYTGNVDLTPWSAPYTPDALLHPGFNLSEGCDAQGFAPQFVAGTASNNAGVYSPLTLGFSRSDAEQDFDALEATLPPGLLAKIAGVPKCGEAEANAGTCPESTRIGSVAVSAGPGTDPYTVAGQVYLTGPYNGGPFGEVVEVPAVAGPFNLGVVTVRGSIRINPTTAQATVVSNAFPQILDGIPLQVRTVSVTLDRSGFTFNPTSCGQQAVTGRLVSTQGAVAGVSSPFAATNCAGLGFKPGFSASTAGRASKAGGASLDVKVTYPSGPFGSYANIKSVKVDLPKQLPSRLTTLQKACLAATFEANPASCPAASDVGIATATTPLLNVPVSGPAYLVSHGGEAFPDLEIVLQGEGVTLVLVGNTQIKKGITSSTFKSIPDAPVSGFELKLPTGKYSILGANVPASAKYSLCGQKLAMPTAITGQNGMVIKQTTKIGVAGCPKAHKSSRHKRARKARR